MRDFEPIFATLRCMMIEAAQDAIVATDRPGDLVIHSRETDSRTGKAIWFGAVAIKKNYVAYHLFPLYADPSLGGELSEDLARRRQGKSCFNFKMLEPKVFAELGALTRKAAERIGPRKCAASSS